MQVPIQDIKYIENCFKKQDDLINELKNLCKQNLLETSVNKEQLIDHQVTIDSLKKKINDLDEENKVMYDVRKTRKYKLTMFTFKMSVLLNVILLFYIKLNNFF